MSATHINFSGWLICYDTHFNVRQCRSCSRRGERKWVRPIELATRRAPNPWRWGDIFCNRCQKEADAFHLQWDKFLKRRLILYIFFSATYLLQKSTVPPSCTEILWDNSLQLCEFVLRRGKGQGVNLEMEHGVIQNPSKMAQQTRRYCCYCVQAFVRSNGKTVWRCRCG